MSTWLCMPIPAPYQATAAPGTLINAVGATSNGYDKGREVATDLLQRPFSVCVRLEVI